MHPGQANLRSFLGVSPAVTRRNTKPASLCLPPSAKGPWSPCRISLGPIQIIAQQVTRSDWEPSYTRVCASLPAQFCAIRLVRPAKQAAPPRLREKPVPATAVPSSVSTDCLHQAPESARPWGGGWPVHPLPSLRARAACPTNKSNK